MADEPLSRVEEILEGGSPPLLSRIEKLLKEGGAGGGVSPEQIAAAVAAYLDEHGAVIDVDSELSTTSEKPVQNKVIAAALQEHDVFIAENGVTTNAEIYAAFQAGKVVICVHNDDEYYLSECKANSARFVCPVKSTGYVLSFRVSDNVWHANTPTRFAKTNDLSGYYTKPSGGIPASDLASAVQTSLGKAETALQQHQSLSGYATETWVQQQGYQTAQQVQTAIAGKADASSVYTKTEVDQKLVGAMDYKGTKATVSELPTSGNATGDVWHIDADGSEWAWNGSTWEELGTAVDLSGYRTASAQDAIDAAQNTAIAAKYTKPSTGIPKTDLASDVKASLGKADTALQEHQSLASYRTASTQDEIDNAQNVEIRKKANSADLAAVATSGSYNDLADKPSIPSLAGYATEAWVNNKGYLTLADLPVYNGGVS